MAAPRKRDHRDPNTVADKEVYGFRTIEEADVADGPGWVEPVEEPAYNAAGENSTFGSRSKTAGQSESKAVQAEGKRAENKAVAAAEKK